MRCTDEQIEREKTDLADTYRKSHPDHTVMTIDAVALRAGCNRNAARSWAKKLGWLRVRSKLGVMHWYIVKDDQMEELKERLQRTIESRSKISGKKPFIDLGAGLASSDTPKIWDIFNKQLGA